MRTASDLLASRTKQLRLPELLPRIEIALEIEPGDEQCAFYEALRCAACHPALIDAGTGLESAKQAALLDLAAELIANRHRPLVFSQFTGLVDVSPKPRR